MIFVAVMMWCQKNSVRYLVYTETLLRLACGNPAWRASNFHTATMLATWLRFSVMGMIAGPAWPGTGTV